MTQILNSYRQQWARLRGNKPSNPAYRCGPVTVLKPKRGKLVAVKIIERFNREGKPIGKP